MFNPYNTIQKCGFLFSLNCLLSKAFPQKDNVLGRFESHFVLYRLLLKSNTIESLNIWLFWFPITYSTLVPNNILNFSLKLMKENIETVFHDKGFITPPPHVCAGLHCYISQLTKLIVLADKFIFKIKHFFSNEKEEQKCI